MIAILKFELKSSVLTISITHYPAPQIKIKSNVKKKKKKSFIGISQ